MKHHMLAVLLLTTATCMAEEIVLCASSNQPIPDGSTAGVTIQFQVPEAPEGRVVLGVRLDLEVEHPWVGDIVVRLVAPDQTRHVDVIERVGMVPYGFPGPFGCGGDDILASFDDGAPEAADDACAIGPQPVLAGELRPSEALAQLAGIEPAGMWSLVITDRQQGDLGHFKSACLRIDVATDCNGDGIPDECDCPGDLNQDGWVDGADLAEMLGVWGSDDPNADLDGDGTVSGSDLSIILGYWGECP